MYIVEPLDGILLLFSMHGYGPFSKLYLFAFFQSPDTYMSFAILWLSLRGTFARRRIGDRDRWMTPVAMSPRDMVITSVVIAAITVGLVESVAWSSFVLWLG